MRWLGRALTVVALVSSFVPPSPANAEANPLAALAGHWRCTVAHAHAAERSYFFTAGKVAGGVLYGRQDTTEANGEPSFSLERIERNEDGSGRIEAVEGTGSTASGDAPLRFASGTFALAYTVEGDTMHRVATDGGTTLDDERCTRLPPDPVPSPCPDPNVRASTLSAAEPNYPAAAVASRASGVVLVIVVLDDRSHVVWTEVARSDNPLFNDEAVRAARLSTYRAQVRNCRVVAGKYLFSVDFSYNRR